MVAIAIRDGTDADSAGAIELIQSVFSEYDGCVFDIAELADLRAPATAYRRRGGRFWVAEASDCLAGMLAMTPHGAAAEIHRLYVKREHRRNGIARQLMARALEEAAAQGTVSIELWTDTRFVEGHRFYESIGFERQRETRELHDLSNSVEYHYTMRLPAGRAELTIARVEEAALRENIVPFRGLLQDAVDSGASVGFLPPLADGEAAAYWVEVVEALAGGSRILLSAAIDGHVVGAVQLDLARKPNARHRAEVMKLMVHRNARRRGIGQALMLAAEAEARSLGRTLLVLDTRRGDPSEVLYEKLGYQRAGVIPDYACCSDGQLHDTVFFYKRV
jgi:GNAT superfamily N-acetyltransferase